MYNSPMTITESRTINFGGVTRFDAPPLSRAGMSIYNGYLNHFMTIVIKNITVVKSRG
jgi:hypothetical protein